MASIDQQESPAADGPLGALGSGSPVLARPRPTPRPRIELCPYCGRESVNTTRCTTCGGYFDALSKQATQNAMGPWWLRDGERPIKPGCSYDTIRSMVAKGSITRETVLRGPTTRQFWMRASRVPGVAHLMGVCHSCQREASPGAFMCAACGASFNTETDRQHLGLSPVSLLPGQAGAERIAAVSAASVPIAAPVPLPAPAGEQARTGSSPLVGGYEADGAGGPRAGLGHPIDEAWAARARLAGVRLSPAAMAAAGGLPGPSAPMAGPIGSYAGFETADSSLAAPGGRRRGGSMAGAVGMMLLGATVAAGGVWIALVRASGGVDGALAAIGVRERVVLADAGPGASGEAPPTPSGEAGTHGPAPAPPDGGANAAEIDEAPVAARPEGAPADDVATGEAPATAGTPAEAMLATLADHVGQARWREAGELVEQMERSGAMGVDEAAAWRMALTARAARAELAGLP